MYRDRRVYHRNTPRESRSAIDANGRVSSTRAFLRDGNMDRRITGRLRGMGRAKRLLLGHNAPAKRTGEPASFILKGEGFRRPGTIQCLKSRGHEFDVNGASYLVHLYEEDPLFPARLNGRFHGLVVDRSEKTALLFNDRYGMHRIYYHESKDGFFFAAEAKAILAVQLPNSGELVPAVWESSSLAVLF